MARVLRHFGLRAFDREPVERQARREGGGRQRGLSHVGQLHGRLLANPHGVCFPVPPRDLHGARRRKPVDTLGRPQIKS